ncbi:MAG: BrnA antitoxin family protein [Chloroflexi bacterium]|nr:BrnA antitoxin family protein [Chloroflexota bacterium]MYF23030.1 BrnA antitoxin family protein [Chloroflexota bacterium]
MTKDLDDLPTRVQQELLALDKLADEDIDLSDIPEVTDWSGAERGKFYRPVKQQITLRIDADVIAWFKAQAPQGRGYQTNINQALRDHVQRTARSTR